MTPSGLITDIDGTIAPIAPTPQEARVSSLCRRAMASLASRLTLVAALSGRDALQAKEMVAIENVVYIGNHGLEKWENGKLKVWEEAKGYMEAIRGLVERLHQDIKMPGLAIEDKGLTASIHYRQTLDPPKARSVIFHFLNTTPGARALHITEGKLVVEIRPPVMVDKGTSIRLLIQDKGLKGVVYMGDDTSDVDAFRAIRRLSSEGHCHGLSLGVLGEEAPSELEQEADLLLQGVADVEELLLRIAEA